MLLSREIEVRSSDRVAIRHGRDVVVTHRDELDRVNRDARELIVFADGIEEGLPGFAARSRVTARDAIELVEALRSERSARLAMRDARDRMAAMLLARVTPTPAQIDEAACAA